MTMTQTSAVHRVHAWQRLLVVAALVASVVLLGWAYQTGGDTLRFRFGWVAVVLTAVPLFVTRGRQFTYACLAVGVSLLVLACGPVPAGLLPAMLVLLATTADPRRSPWRARLSVLVGAALVVVPVVASAGAVHDSLTSPPVGFVVHTDADTEVTDLVGPGDVSVVGVHTRYDDGDGGPISFVEFTPGLSADGQDQLRRQLALKPGVSKICSWYRNNHLRSAC
ncbi:hypothetical protein [Micromonospora sp. DT63]|uniref:hypothetical protein n=1 Tax=Micromonospora sp. DT63 TaxID=3393441 RepID=UPI003CE94D76